MTAAETIEQAIARLEEKRAAAMRGPWGNSSGDLIGPDDFDSLFSEENAELIVTLHRTIDAQLDMLRFARGFYGAQITGPESSTAFAELALALAAAILGETQL